MPQPTERRKLIAFIDGFNLYYGLLQDWPDRKWLMRGNGRNGRSITGKLLSGAA